MSKNSMSNVQLGLFVTIGLVFLLAALYLIGSNQNLFDRTFNISATFHNVNGLMAGNNVRFSGIDVGTVKQLEIISDSTVKVTMIIKDDARKFIKKNSLASIGTDGLMGNKLVNISGDATPAGTVEDGDAIRTRVAVETDQMLRTLDQTNINLFEITTDLKRITQNVNKSKTLWTILSDSTLGENLRRSMASIRDATRNTELFTQDLNGFLHDVKSGKGMIGYLMKDTVAPEKLRRSIAQINEASKNAEIVTTDLKQLTEKIKHGEGPAGVLLTDTAFARNLKESMVNIRISSAKFSENMEAMKHNFLFKGYFKDQEKKSKKGTSPQK